MTWVDVCEIRQVSRNKKTYYIPIQTTLDLSANKIFEITPNQAMSENKKEGLLPEEITVEDFCDISLDVGGRVLTKTVLGSKQYLIDLFESTKSGKKKILKG